jgi:dTDP-4-dehydrorhamnose 3,5-epimerase-like enzyme
MTRSLPEGVALIPFRQIADPRGDLIVGESGEQLPFVPRRVFFIHRVPNRQLRGEHAHRRCHQLLVCVKGRVTVLVEDLKSRAEICLDRPSMALHVPPMIWAAQFNYSEDAMLMVLASERYDEGDYIRDHSAWQRELNDEAAR